MKMKKNLILGHLRQRLRRLKMLRLLIKKVSIKNERILLKISKLYLDQKQWLKGLILQ